MGRTAAHDAGQLAAYVGLDAFSVPMPCIGASQAEHRMLYTALLYTPGEEHTHYGRPRPRGSSTSKGARRC